MRRSKIEYKHTELTNVNQNCLVYSYLRIELGSIGAAARRAREGTFSIHTYLALVSPKWMHSSTGI
jgi:hypothetical protein